MKRALLLTIRLYQRLLSPLLLPACRYVPTCSEYAHDAVDLHGSARGAMLAAWRLLRCHPFSRGGYDPVPSDESLQDPAFMRARLHDAPPDETLDNPAFMRARLHDAPPDTTLDNPAFMRLARLNDATPDETLDNPALMRLARLHDAPPDTTLDNPAFMRLARLHDAPPDETLDNPVLMWARLHDATHPSRERLDTRIPEGCNDNSPALQCRVAGTTRPQVP